MQYGTISGTGLSALVGTHLAIPSKADRQICIDMMPVAQNNIWMNKAAQTRLSNRSYTRQDECGSATSIPLSLFLATGNSSFKKTLQRRSQFRVASKTERGITEGQTVSSRGRQSSFKKGVSRNKEVVSSE